MKISPVEAELFPADRRTHLINLIVASCNFVNVPKTEDRVAMKIERTTFTAPVCEF